MKSKLKIFLLDNYNTNGNTVSDDKIDEIHESSFIEFDYETASKNYIIPLENSDENCIIKLADTGGTVVSYNLKNIDKIIDMADSQSEGQKSYKFEYSEMYSKNKFYYSSDIDTSQFETINYKIY